MGKRVGLAAVLYALLGGAAVAWCLVHGQSPIALAPERRLLDWSLAARVGLSLAIGLAVALAVILSTRRLVRRTRWARVLHTSFRELLGPMTGGQIAFFAISSGVAEELFFRGALQVEIGLIAASLIFGLVHFGPSRDYLPWTVWAILMGFVFGALYELTGSLAGPIVAHVVINYENLHFIRDYDPDVATRVRRTTPDAPGLVGDRLRAGGRAVSSQIPDR